MSERKLVRSVVDEVVGKLMEAHGQFVDGKDDPVFLKASELIRGLFQEVEQLREGEGILVQSNVMDQITEAQCSFEGSVQHAALCSAERALKVSQKELDRLRKDNATYREHLKLRDRERGDWEHRWRDAMEQMDRYRSASIYCFESWRDGVNFERDCDVRGWRYLQELREMDPARVPDPMSSDMTVQEGREETVYPPEPEADVEEVYPDDLDESV